jgi:hypothetical protein
LNATECKIRYRNANLLERSLAQQHFLDLCEVLGHRHPVEVLMPLRRECDEVRQSVETTLERDFPNQCDGLLIFFR